MYHVNCHVPTIQGRIQESEEGGFTTPLMTHLRGGAHILGSSLGNKHSCPVVRHIAINIAIAGED